MQEEELLLYPSISVCKKYSIEHENLFVANISYVGNETDVARVVESVEKRYKEDLALEKQIFFFTQPGAMNMTFPCTTTHGGSAPGRPCIFPVHLTYHNKTTMYSGCLNGDILEIPDRACFTKVFKNNSVNFDKASDLSWGYCPKSCEGQTASPQSSFNLAKSNNTNLWTSKFYDFSDFEDGFCHTYDPPGKSDPDFISRTYFMISNNPDYLNQKYQIFIHERGQFWPRYNMMSFGQPDPLTLSPNKELEISFSINKIRKLRKKGTECVKETEFSFTKCLHEYAIFTSKCHIGLDEKNCTKEGFISYFKILVNLKRHNIAYVKRISGCYPKCKHTIYTLEVHERTKEGHSNWTSEVYIQPKSSEVKYSTEYYSFDINDLISNIGGNLGLFLGWSLLTFFEGVSILIMIAKIGKNYNTK